MARVLVEPGVVTVVTLNRPEALNALDTGLLEELERAFRALEARAVVVTGAGSAFCSGADLKERAELSDDVGGLTTPSCTGPSRSSGRRRRPRSPRSRASPSPAVSSWPLRAT